MRQRGVFLVIALLLLAATPLSAGLPTPPPGPFVPHAPIIINSNADFTAANGVVAGTGSPGDPFIISGWTVTSSTSGIGIKIHNVSAYFVVRDNAIDAGIGLQLTASASVGQIVNNQFVVRTTGILVSGADARIVDNALIGLSGAAGNRKGIDLYNSNAHIEGNAFLYVNYGVRAERGSPVILCNDFHDDIIVAAVSLQYTVSARVECNIMTRCSTAISTVLAFGTIVVNNTVSDCYVGIHAVLTKDLEAHNNTIRFSSQTQVILDTTSGNFTGNVVIDGRVDGVLILRSPMIIANNTVSNHIGVGLRFKETTADVSANVMVRNSIGIMLEGGSVPHLTANVMTNNTVGIDLPYASRQAIVHMSANLVNNVSVDGAINASQQVFFYKAANVTIDAQVRDSGFDAGFFGSLTAQGGVVLYEVDTATIDASVIAHHNIGVGVVNSFNVNVNASVLSGNLIGIKAEVQVTGYQVPNCVVSVKDTNITIPVDPALTLGIEVKGCLAFVGRTNVSIVDIGIKVDAQAGLTLFNSTIEDTKIALDVQGIPNMVNISGNVIVNNRAGARLSGTIGLVAENTFLDNDEYGVRLENDARITLNHNNFTENGIGLIDAEVCGGSLTCSTVTATSNTFIANRGVGANVNGATTWRDDRALDNDGDGFVLGSTVTLRGVIASGNLGDGARLTGTFEVRDSTFSRNEADGLDLRGAGSLRDSTFTFNEQAGIRVAATFVTAIHLNVSRNFDGILASEAILVNNGIPAVNVPSLLNAISTSGGPEPFDIHRSILSGNERDAIRAGVGVVNATHNWFGRSTGPSISVADTVGTFQNGVSPAVRFVPWYQDEQLTTTGPVPGI